MKTVAITGASSLIGRSLASVLVARGDRVVAFQRGEFSTNPGDADLVAQVEQRRGDVRDRAALDTALGGCDVVVHLAAKVGVVGDRDEYVAINVDGTRNVLAAAKHNGLRGVVHVSSPSVAHDGHPIVGGAADPPVEDHGAAWYPETKAIAECEALAASDERCAVVAIRPHLVWGPGDTQLVGRIVERAEAGRLALVGGGQALVDTTYIDNAATALAAAVDAVRPGEVCAGKAYVVSNGEPRPIRELVEAFCRAADVPFAPRDVPLPVALRIGSIIDRIWPRLNRSDEPPLTRFIAEQLGTAHWFDQRAVRADLSWQPEVSIDQGLEALADWFGAGRTESASR